MADNKTNMLMHAGGKIRSGLRKDKNKYGHYKTAHCDSRLLYCGYTWTLFSGSLFGNASEAPDQKPHQTRLFDIAPCANPELEHSPDDDTHSVILKVIEKRWWKVDVWREYIDPLESLIGFFPPILLLISLMGICNQLTHADNPTENLMAWEEKLMPYYIPIFITCIAINLTWIVASWFNKKLCLRKAVRNRNYTCELRATEKILCNADAILEVYESNAADFVHIKIYFSDKAYRGFHAAIMLKVERTPLRES